MLGSKFLKEVNTRSSISEIQVWPWIDIIMEEFWHRSLIYPFKLCIISISRNLKEYLGPNVLLNFALFPISSGPILVLGPSKDYEPCEDRPGIFWMGWKRVPCGWASSSPWNHSSTPRVQGWECHILVLNHLALFGAPLLALFCF